MSKTIDEIKARLAKGETVQVRGFGTFRVKDVPARTFRNPLTGDAVHKSARRKVTFKATKGLML